MVKIGGTQWFGWLTLTVLLTKVQLTKILLEHLIFLRAKDDREKKESLSLLLLTAIFLKDLYISNYIEYFARAKFTLDFFTNIQAFLFNEIKWKLTN